MTVIREAIGDYLAVRRVLGYKLEDHGWLLADFASFLEAAGAGAVTISLALEWATLPADCLPSWHAARLRVVRGFARHLRALDPATEVPPAGRRAVGAGSDSGAVAQPPERLPDARVDQPGAGRGDEEARRCGVRAELVADLGVAFEFAEGGVQDGHHAGLAELRFPGRQYGAIPVEISAVEPDRFSDPQAGGGQQASPPPAAPRQPAAAASGPANTNLSSERSSPTRPLTEPTLSRSLSASKNATTSPPDRLSSPPRPARGTLRSERASFTYLTTVASASPRSLTSHRRYCSASTPAGAADGEAPSRTP